jgi:hypothetical protein
MADRYWVVGGTGNYNSTTNWSATSGGASGASFPSVSDNVFFNALSGAGIAIINVASNCLNLNLTGFLGTLDFTFNLSTSGTAINLGLGTYTVTGVSALRFQTATAITSNGSSWTGNIMFATNGVFTLVDNLTVLGTTSFQGTISPVINGNTLNIKGNLTISTSGTISGTTIFSFTGTGTWTHTVAGLISNALTINTAGTLTISGTVYKQTGLFTYTAGTIIDTTGTVVVQSLTLNLSGFTFRKLLVNNTITLTSNINAVTFGTTGANATSFVLGGNTLNFTHLELGNTGTTTLPTAWVCQNIEFLNASAGVLNTNSITINGNIVQSGAGVYSGTTTFTYAGTGTWTAPSINSYFSNSFTINTAGVLLFISANLGGGIFTYTAGTVATAGSTLNIVGNGTTLNDGIIVWWDVFTVINVSNLVLNNQLVCLNALTIDNSQVAFSGADGTFDVYNLYLNSSGTIARNPKLVALKTYRVRAVFKSQGTLAFPITLSSSVGASQAIFTVDQGAIIDVGFCNTKDINSSLGRRIYSYKGSFVNTLNWDLLPIDVTPSSGVFVN